MPEVTLKLRRPGPNRVDNMPVKSVILP